MTGKRITQKEKKERARIKKQLQADGILPPNKPRLNRRKFVEESRKEWQESLQYGDERYLYEAIQIFLTDVKFTPEHIGVAKVCKIAVQTKAYMEQLKSQGKSQYNVKDYFDEVVDPILRL